MALGAWVDLYYLGLHNFQELGFFLVLGDVNSCPSPPAPPLGTEPLPSLTEMGIPENGERSLKLMEVGWKVPEQLAATNHPCMQSNESCSQLCLGDNFSEKVSGYFCIFLLV